MIVSINQYVNLTKFIQILLGDVDGMIDKDPTYIQEKWDKYIGVSDLKFENMDVSQVKHNPDLCDYISRWGEDIKGNNFMIIYFVSQVSRNNPIESNVIIFKNIIGSPKKILNTDTGFNGIHPLLKDHINKYLEHEENKGFINKVKRSDTINKLL